MRLILDTNILISALLSPRASPAALVEHWRKGRFTLLCAEAQIDELRRVSRYPRIRERLLPAIAGRLVNDLRSLAMMVGPLPVVDLSPDPFDNYLLAMAEAAEADWLVTGDKADLLALRAHGRTRIVTAREMLVEMDGD